MYSVFSMLFHSLLKVDTGLAYVPSGYMSARQISKQQ